MKVMRLNYEEDMTYKHLRSGPINGTVAKKRKGVWSGREIRGSREVWNVDSAQQNTI